MSFICNKCGQSVKDENGVLISGKYYGPDCAARILGLSEMPSWFKGGDWEIASKEREKTNSVLSLQRAERMAKMSDNWPLIHSISVAYQRARSMDNNWEISFLQSIATKLGMQFCKETAYRYNSFNDFISNQNNYPDDVHGLSNLSEKQKDILSRII